MPKSLVVLSDIHVGHRLALSPLNSVAADDSTYRANKVQRALYEAYSEVVKDWKNPDILVVNGEPIDGQQPKNRGVEVWTTDYLTQVDAAVSLVKMLGSKKTYVTRGSNYHVSVGGVSVEEIFGQQVGAKKVDGVHVVPELFLDVDGVTLNFAHHIASSASGWMYRSTPSAKEAMLMKLAENRKHPTDILVRSHVHYFWVVQSASHLSMTTPAWQLQTWFMMQKSSAGTIPDIGAVRFLIDEGSYSWEKKLYRMNEWRPARVKA